jgi:hypothetical protein
VWVVRSLVYLVYCARGSLLAAGNTYLSMSFDFTTSTVRVGDEAFAAMNFPLCNCPWECAGGFACPKGSTSMVCGVAVAHTLHRACGHYEKVGNWEG